LSGGQQQRVGVARALGADPPILLMDEPFGAIDPVTRERLQDELLRLQEVVKKTIVFVTHDIDEATKLADHIALYEPRGKLAQYAAPVDLLGNPASEYVELFLGSGRLIRRLGMLSLRNLALGPADGSPASVRVGRDATLREAFEAVLSAPDGRVLVVDGDVPAGILDADAIRRAAQ